ncbi:Monocarboxylate transporter 3 [Eumeta japonica]|uniref:Monocarboxylate transporter 3 n=1 Tax=Eumeta variegata TaxID=151549 RepID=A0A4C1U3P7_EUMVA|nr:Monocarboxylate transporter 3 [Eumeta japonica]
MTTGYFGNSNVQEKIKISTGPLVSALCNKFGCRAVCVTGALIATTAFVLSTFSQSITTMMLTYGVLGVLSPVLTHCLCFYIISTSAKRTRTQSTANAHAAARSRVNKLPAQMDARPANGLGTLAQTRSYFSVSRADGDTRFNHDSSGTRSLRALAVQAIAPTPNLNSSSMSSNDIGNGKLKLSFAPNSA